jgi:tryptophan-rich sensory protein
MKKISFTFNRQFFVCLTVTVLSVLAVALLGVLFTDTDSEWYRNLIKPAIQPSGIVFSVVWSVLFVLVGITLFYSCCRGLLKENRALLVYYIASGVLNVLWSFVFFKLQRPTMAFVVILAYFVVTLLLCFEFKEVKSWVKYLFIPYMAWIFFASVLNYTIVMLN